MPIALPVKPVKRANLFLFFILMLALVSVAIEIADPAPMDAVAASSPAP